MDNPAQVRPEPALISAVLAAAVGLAALAVAIAVQRSAAGIRRRLRAGSAQSDAAVDRLTHRLGGIRAELNRLEASVALTAVRLGGIDAQVDTWTARFASVRGAARQLNEGSLVPVTRLIRAVEIALQIAGLWRNPFG
jgi:hypothetical protein